MGFTFCGGELIFGFDNLSHQTVEIYHAFIQSDGNVHLIYKVDGETVIRDEIYQINPSKPTHPILLLRKQTPNAINSQAINPGLIFGRTGKAWQDKGLIPLLEEFIFTLLPLSC